MGLDLVGSLLDRLENLGVSWRVLFVCAHAEIADSILLFQKVE